MTNISKFRVALASASLAALAVTGSGLSAQDGLREQAGPAPDMSDARRYKAGEYFFKPLAAA